MPAWDEVKPTKKQTCHAIASLSSPFWMMLNDGSVTFCNIFNYHFYNTLVPGIMLLTRQKWLRFGVCTSLQPSSSSDIISCEWTLSVWQLLNSKYEKNIIHLILVLFIQLVFILYFSAFCIFVQNSHNHHLFSYRLCTFNNTVTGAALRVIFMMHNAKSLIFQKWMYLVFTYEKYYDVRAHCCYVFSVKMQEIFYCYNIAFIFWLSVMLSGSNWIKI